MSDKMIVREGNDGYCYPYTSPDLVVDENGKSNTKKFEEIDSQFKDIAKQMKGFNINLFEAGCNTNLDSASNNTLIINNLIQQGKNIIVTDLFPISDSLIINKNFNNCKIIGLQKKNTGFLMTSNNPIIVANQTNTSYIELKHLSLIYKDKQINDISSAILFTNKRDSDEDNTGYYRWVLESIFIENCYNGIYLEKSKINVWGTIFKDIHISNCYNNAIKLDGVSQLQNLFKDIKIINIQDDNGLYVNKGEPCLILTGEYDINGLDIENWKHTSGKALIMLENSLSASFCIIKNIHLESITFNKTMPVFFSCRGINEIENLRIYHTIYGDYVSKVLLCQIYQSNADVDGGTKVSINGFTSEKIKTNTVFKKYLGGIGDYYQFYFNVNNFINKNYGNNNDIWENFENVGNHYTKNVTINNNPIKSNSFPTGGTWEFNDIVIRNELQENTNIRAYYCKKPGTFGEIKGVTITNATENILSSNKFTYGALKTGQYILLNSKTYKIIEIDTSDDSINKVILDKNVESNIASLDITYSEPIFINLTI